MPRERRQPIHVAEGNVRVYAPTPSRPGYYRITWPDPADGPRKEAFARNAKTARKRANQIARELGSTDDGLRPVPMDRVIDEWLDPGSHSPRWSDAYAERQESYARTWLRPVLGRYRSDQLTPALAARVLSTAVEHGRATSTVESVGAALRGLITWAQGERYVPARPDPMEGVRYARTPEQAGESVHLVRDEEVPEVEHVWQLAEAMRERSERLGKLPGTSPDVVGAEGRWLQPLMAAYSGMRQGEQLAVRASDLDVEGCLVSVERALSVTTRGGVKLVPPKYGKRRKTIFPGELQDPLGRLKAHRVARDGPDAVLWVAPMGGWETRHSLREKRFNPAAALAGWPRNADGVWWWTWHSLRHFFCTTCLNQPSQGGYGLSLATTSALAGHHDESFTAKRYIGTQGELHKQAAQAAQALEIRRGQP